MNDDASMGAAAVASHQSARDGLRNAAQEYSEKLARKAALDLELKQLTNELAALEPEVLKWFEATGVDKARLEDGRTLYLRRELWAGQAKGVPSEVAVEALRAAGLGEFCQPRINASRLSAWARELDREGTPLPDGLRGIVEVREVFKVGHRKGATTNGDQE